MKPFSYQLDTTLNMDRLPIELVQLLWESEQAGHFRGHQQDCFISKYDKRNKKRASPDKKSFVPRKSTISNENPMSNENPRTTHKNDASLVAAVDVCNQSFQSMKPWTSPSHPTT